MVNAKVAAQPSDASNVHGPAFERFPAHETSLGSLKVALPDSDRHGPASFQHLDEVPIIEQAGGTVTVFAGSVLGYSSPAKHVSHVLGAEIVLSATASLELPLDQSFEHAALLLTGDANFKKRDSYGITVA